MGIARMAVAPFSPKLDSEPSYPIAQSRKGLECFSLEDLVVQRHAGGVVNPWLSRWVILCKDGCGKIGLRVQTYNKGVFVSLVIASSPAAHPGQEHPGGDEYGCRALQAQVLTCEQHCA